MVGCSCRGEDKVQILANVSYQTIGFLPTRSLHLESGERPIALSFKFPPSLPPISKRSAGRVSFFKRSYG